MIWNFVAGLVSPITDIVKGWQKKKQAKLDGEIAIAKAVNKAKIDRLATEQKSDMAWENTALVNAGIKDEIMMAVILLPMVLCFIPGGDVIVRRGFTTMRECLPEYWEYAFYATIGVSYGIRKWTDFKSIIKG
jgi:hypothetical protein